MVGTTSDGDRADNLGVDRSGGDDATLWIALTRGTVVTIGLVVLLAWQDRSSATTAKIIGGIVLAAALTSLLVERRFHVEGSGRRRAHLWMIGLLAAIGAVLMLWPTATIQVIGRCTGGGLLLLGASGTIRAARASRSSERRWAITRGLLLAVVGLVILYSPARFSSVMLIAIVVAWAAEAIISLVALLTDEESRGRSAWSVGADLALRRLEELEMTPSHREALEDSLYYEGAAYRDRLWRFAVLIVLSTTIAALGIIGDSTAVVVGAMLIAPLMTPIMATAAALVMAWPARVLRSLGTVAGGVVLAVGVSWLLTGLFPQASEAILGSSQVTSRVNPTTVDLLIALAAGAAGAYALSRPDVSDSLPGVAIAVALVPPLAVVGITFQLRAWDEGLGALLLFLTNLVAIILAGGGVFVLTGFTPVGRLRTRRSEVGRSFAIVGVLAAVIAVPLGVQSRSLLADSAAYDEAEAAVAAWSAGTDLRLVEITIRGPEVDVVVAGVGEVGGIEELGTMMERALSRDVELRLVVIPTLEFTYETGD